jgi:alkaline phosphatase D
MTDMRVMLAISFLLLPLGAVWAQEKTKEQQPKPPNTPKQYKRVHQRILKPLLDGKIVRARSILDAAVKRDPLDPETWFLKTIVDAAEGKVEDALAAMSRALELKLPPERFLAGPRKLFAPIAKTKLFEMLEARFAHRPVHGPMLGDLTGKSVKVWLRTAKACKVEVLVHPKGDGKSKPIFGHAATTAASDFTTVVQVNGLTPKTEYEYSLRIDGGDPVKGGAFKSFARKGDMCQLRVAFGGGSGYVPEHERMWDTIRSFKPDMIMLLGDNVYIDAPKHRELQRYCYYRRQSRPEFRRLVANIPVYSIWDDHDFGTNDCFHGAEIDKPAWKPKVLEVYTQNWANPGYGIPKTPGCFYDFQVGNLFFMMLDGRHYRTDPKIEKPSMLGEPQANWIRYRLAEVRTPLKMVCSPVPWTFDAKGKSLDTWNGFQEERKGIFDFIGGYKVEGVVLLSADRHRTDIWKLPRPEHYPFTEFNSSRLTNQHVHPTMAKAQFSYNKKQSFGLIEFDTEAQNPKITMKVINIDGEVVHTLNLRYSDLCYK